MLNGNIQVPPAHFKASADTVLPNLSMALAVSDELHGGPLHFHWTRRYVQTTATGVATLFRVGSPWLRGQSPAIE